MTASYIFRKLFFGFYFAIPMTIRMKLPWIFVGVDWADPKKGSTSMLIRKVRKRRGLGKGVWITIWRGID